MGALLILLTGGLAASVVASAPERQVRPAEQIVRDYALPPGARPVCSADEESCEAPVCIGCASSSRAKPSGRRGAVAAPAGRMRAGVRSVAGTRSVASLAFANGSAELTPGARAQVDEYARLFTDPRFKLRAARFVVEGHTNSPGGRAMNLDLSRRRAAAVVAYLESKGVSPGRLNAEGLGPDRPLAGRRPADGANRRVEIVRR